MSDQATPNRRPHRQICFLCHHPCRVHFWVPDEIWRLALHPSQWTEMVCLECFTRLADERLVEWCAEIQFYPVSLAVQIRSVEEVLP